jgi:glycosyltransferase involved in cell wall biosynthesis
MGEEPAPRITICIPTYNRGEWLRSALQSALDQGYPDFAVVVSDNGSEDDTCATVKSFDDPRIRYVRRDRNYGAHDNINFVVAQARTEFVVLLPDDDALLPGGLERAIDVLDRYPNVGYVHSAFDVVDLDGGLLEKSTNWFLPRRGDGAAEHGDAFECGLDSIKRSLFTGVRVCQATAVYRRALLPDPLLELDGNEPQPDLYLYLALGLKTDTAFVDAPGAVFRRYDASARTGESHWQVLPDGWRVFREDIALRDRDLKLAWISEHEDELRDPSALRELVLERTRQHLLHLARVQPTRRQSFASALRVVQLEPSAVRDKRTWRRLVGSLRKPKYSP